MIPGLEPTFVDFLKDTIMAVRACFSKINLRNVTAQIPSTQECTVSRGAVEPEEKYAAIRAYIWAERKRRGIIPADVPPAAGPSDTDVGEFYIFVERDLMLTKEKKEVNASYANSKENPWYELKNNSSLLDGAYRHVIKKGFRGY